MKLFCICFISALFIALRAVSAQEFGSDSSIELIAPQPGDTFHVGDAITVQWILHNNAIPGGGVMILISPDEGLSWTRIMDQTIKNADPAYYKDSIGTFSWTIIDSAQLFGSTYVHFESDRCMAMVGAPYDGTFVPSESGVFKIDPRTSVQMPFRSGERSYRANKFNLHVSEMGPSGGHLEIFSISGRSMHTGARELNAGLLPGACIIRERANTKSQIQSLIVCR